ncbi:unnamed protein product, partial [Porites evermanni]
MSESGKSDQQDHENLRTVMAFFAFGTLIYNGFSLFITAAQDILAGTYIQSSMVLIACILPSFVFTLIAPYFVQKISYFARFIALGLALPCGLLILALAEQVYWKLIGLGIASVDYSMSEMTVLGLTSFYHEVALTAFSAGTGVGYVITPFYYTALTTWACVSPQIAIVIMAVVSLLIPACYYIMDKKHVKSPSPSSEKHAGVEYTALDANKDYHLSVQEKFAVIWKMLPDLITIYIAWFSEYLIYVSVVTTLAFPNAPFSTRDHYQYYIFTLTGGEVVGRSYLVILSYIKADWAEKAKIPCLWGLAIIQVFHLLFFILAVWYRFLPNVWIILLLSFSCGAGIGVFYVNAVAFFKVKFEGPEKEFAMGYLIVAIIAGVLAAALLGLYIEPVLREHCTMILNNAGLCFTRSHSSYRLTSSC